MGSKTSTMRKKRDNLAKVVAEIHGVSPSYVAKIRRGERENEEIMATIMDYLEGESILLMKLKQLVPLDKKREKRPKTTLKDLEKRSKGGQLSL
ncbi:MAG: hypothetical protein ACJ75J_01050 [Cytophagaceae bacterium]